MQSIFNIINLYANNYHFDRLDIENVEGVVNEEMKPNGWILLEFRNRECVVLKFDNGIYTNEGYLLIEENILRVLGNDEMNGELESTVEEGIVDLDSGSRFEGKVLRGSGIPFGFGKMYGDNGKLMYKGIMINWKRFGYGVNYHDNGEIEYEGYWCDNNRFGNGKVYDLRGRITHDCIWYYGFKIAEEYEGFGSNINIGLKHLKLFNNCILTDWDISLFLNLESIEIRDECFSEVKTFRIDGLNRLKSLKIGKNSFSKKSSRNGNDESKSFHILNCEQLESIEISRKSFFDFAGEFELRNLPSLISLEIGTVGRESMNFFCSSFVIRGGKCILKTDYLDLPKLKTMTLGDRVFFNSLTIIVESIN